ncbi:unnamed protein product [marine sediment metagenome]|uniref:Uncharacterized protein n=1 Tax=marine sediment metagenome TaxID=412755 RepID=X1ALS2_9ZZZZ
MGLGDTKNYIYSHTYMGMVIKKYGGSRTMSDVKMIQVAVSKEEFKRLKQEKDKMTWHDYLCRDI